MKELFDTYGALLIRAVGIHTVYVLISVVIGFILQIAVTEVHFLTVVFGTVELALNEWAILTLAAMIPLVIHEILVPFLRRR